MTNPIRGYAWGSRSFLAELQGRPAPTAEPEAELWMGAHPLAPSGLEAVDHAPPAPSLDAAITLAPEQMVGPEIHQRFGARLPFLLKILAAEEPLSLQAHPDAEQARSGFEREEAAGTPVNGKIRNYKDPYHKPELVCALTRFEALCGFRAVEEIEAVLRALGFRLTRRVEAESTTPPARIRAWLDAMLRCPGHLRGHLFRSTLAAAGQSHFRDGFPEAAALLDQLAARFPGDPTVLVALALRRVELAPGQALFLPARQLHAYLKGAAVEIMATSDNVLRGGLTEKHVDVDELLRVLDTRSRAFQPIDPKAVSEWESVYATPAREFALSRVQLEGTDQVVLSQQGPEILLATGGAPSVNGETLPQGQSLFIPACAGSYAISGPGTLFRARPGESPLP